MRTSSGRTSTGAVLALVVALPVVAAKVVPPEALADWQAYVTATEARRASEVRRSDGYLALDFTEHAAAARRQVLDGHVVVDQVQGPGGDASIDVRSALVHHWRGAILVRGLTLDALLARLREAPPPQHDVLEGRVLDRAGDTMRVFLRLRRQQVITVVYDTEHLVTFVERDASHAASATQATRIVEVADPGTPRERRLSPDEDHGFLWRLHAYWRYEAVPGGVIAECESLALSRGVPFGLGLVAGPIVRRAARDSMEAALMAVAGLGTGQTRPASSPAR